MTQPAKGQEPSMEEILSSIRRIIADDPTQGGEALRKEAAASDYRPQPSEQPASAPPRASSAASLPRDPENEHINAILARLQASSRQVPPPTEEPACDTFESAGEQRTGPEPTAALAGDAGHAKRLHDERPDAASKPPEPASVPHVQEEPRRQSRDGDAQALISAATTAAVDSAFDKLAQTVLVHNGRTLEDLVREMLRPMLKTWLDDNLPSMVERLVRAEIERVSRGRG